MERSRSIWPSASLIFSVAAFVLACGGTQTPDTTARPAAADLVLTGGKIITMDPSKPTATAVAIRHGRIARVGSDADVRALIGPDTKVIELAGRGVTPGLVDAHAHLAGLGAAREQVGLRGLRSAEAVAKKVAAAAATRKPGEWITGRGWDQNLWTPKAFPNHATLDAVVADHPVAVRRVDGHALWANRRAMTIAGITAATPDPPGGRIMRDAQHRPTGVFVDNAMDLVQKHIPAPSRQVRRRRILAAAHYAVSKGLTAVHEMGIDATTAAVYAKLASEGRLPLRVYAFLGAAADKVDALAARKPIIDRGDAFFAARGIKLYADGALGSRGAKLLAPYSDEPGKTGLWVSKPEDLARAARFAAEHGWQLAVHAIGDAAVRAVLDAYARALAATKKSDLRFRVEHAQVISPQDIPRFAKLGVIASMQPTHATSDMPWAEARLGPERIKGAYAWRRVMATGARIIAGSDFPVERVSPLLGLHAAVNRTDRNGKPVGGWYPDQKMTLMEAIEAFTVGPAYGAFVENHRGRLRAGYVADLTVFDRALAPNTLLDTRVDMTIVEGRIVFDRKVK